MACGSVFYKLCDAIARKNRARPECARRRSKDYSEIKDKYRPGHAGYARRRDNHGCRT
jgi:hypothetical protein